MFKNLQNYSIIFRHIKAWLYVCKCSSVFESTSDRKPHLYLQTTHSLGLGSKEYSAIKCFVNKFCRNNNEFHREFLICQPEFCSSDFQHFWLCHPSSCLWVPSLASRLLPTSNPSFLPIPLHSLSWAPSLTCRMPTSGLLYLKRHGRGCVLSQMMLP